MRISFFKGLAKIASIVLAFAATISLSACSGDNGSDGINGADGKDGKNGKDAKEVNVDSLASAIRDEITGTLWDSLYAEPYVDTVYKILFDNAFSDAWMDSVREALIDSLKEADFDSMYAKLYDSVYADIYSQAAIRTLNAWTWSVKKDIYGAFANQYPLMYKDYINSKGEVLPVPVSITVKNTCENRTSFSEPEIPCRWKKITVKSWIDGFTDTASVTDFVNPDTTRIFAPSLKFNNKALAVLTAPEQVQIQIRAYALENDHEILFYSSSEPSTIHPMQINGAEYVNVQNRSLWSAVWVTPNMDSITAIHKELEAKLPNGSVKAYQLYDGDESMTESSARLVKAVYEVLSAKGINYVNNTDAGSPGQKIKYPIEVLRTKQANCIEGTNLFASILESLGMHTVIVNIPGHAFLGWSTNEEDSNYNFLETTMAWGSKPSTFAAAYEKGMSTFTNEQEEDHFTDGSSEIILIENARAFGIRPNDIP